MERGLLGLEVCDHFLGSINRKLITDREKNPPIALNGLVDISTLFTHHCRLFRRKRPATCDILTMAEAFCFSGRLERFNSSLSHSASERREFHPQTNRSCVRS